MAQPPTGRIYGMTWWFKAQAVGMLVVGATLLVRVTPHANTPNWSLKGSGIVLWSALTIAGVVLTAKAFSSSVRFTESGVERRSAFDSLSFPLSIIRGRREAIVNIGRSSYLCLRLVANDGGHLDIGKNYYALDQAFWDWFLQLPDLDAEDAKKLAELPDPWSRPSKFGLD